MEALISWDALVAVANTFGMLLIGVALLIGSEALRLLAGWKTDETVAALRRRLADVEALKRQDYVAAGCTCQRWPTHQANDCPFHGEDSECIHCGTTGWGSDHDADCPFNPTRRFDEDEASNLPVIIGTDHGGRDFSAMAQGYVRADGVIEITALGELHPVCPPNSIAARHLGEEPFAITERWAEDERD